MPTRSESRARGKSTSNESTQNRGAKLKSGLKPNTTGGTGQRNHSDKKDNGMTVSTNKASRRRGSSKDGASGPKRRRSLSSSPEKETTPPKKAKAVDSKSLKQDSPKDDASSRRSPRGHRGRGKYSEQNAVSSSSSDDEDEDAGSRSRSSRAKTKAGKDEKPLSKKSKDSSEKSNSKGKKQTAANVKKVEKQDKASNHSDEDSKCSSDSEIVFMTSQHSVNSDEDAVKEKEEEGGAVKETTKTLEIEKEPELQRRTRSSRELKNLSVWSKDKVVDGRSLVKEGRTRGSKQEAIVKITDTEDGVLLLESSSSSSSASEMVVSSSGELSDDEEDDNDDDVQALDSSDSDSDDLMRDNLQLKRTIQLLQQKLLTVKVAHVVELRAKKDEVERMKNEVKWKDEQLEEMNTLVERNMELEAKLSLLVSDKRAYEEEMESIEKKKKEKIQKEKEEKEQAEKEKKASEEKKKRKETEEAEPAGKGGKRRRSRRKKKNEDESEGEDIDALFVGDEIVIDDEEEEKGEAKKSKKEDKDDDADEITVVDEVKPPKKEEEGENEEDEEGENSPNKGRKDIRKLMTGKKLTTETVAAAKAEKERRERAKKEHDKHERVQEVDPKTKQPLTTKLVLAFDEKTKKPLVQVNNKLIKKLKPHQVEAVEFMWDNLVESMDRLKEAEDPGQGCILAHCMGLGKTLSVITLIHTLLMNDYTTFTTCLVVCPLNTVLNWNYEWEKWFPKRDRLPVFELAGAKSNPDRMALLKEWHKDGGIMIMGYQLFRILANYSGKSKKVKTVFNETLVEPGPDLVVCDEGHMLKNDASAISKAMNRIKTRRRVILTGTPLQNNLIEYHCMVQFVKPNLLGTRREFSNRFVNPITNGQHKDSTGRDVKVMKRRAHVLHEMLNDCVQRRDYSCLTTLLPPKQEYVISVRLSQNQIDLYQKYLDLHQDNMSAPTRGASLFSDYQSLMRIWTHPWVLKLEEARQEKKGYTEDDDDELESILYTSSSEEEEIELEEEETENTEDSEMPDTGNDSEKSEKEYVPRKSLRRGAASKEKGSEKEDKKSSKDSKSEKPAKEEPTDDELEKCKPLKKRRQKQRIVESEDEAAEKKEAEKKGDKKEAEKKESKGDKKESEKKESKGDKKESEKKESKGDKKEAEKKDSKGDKKEAEKKESKGEKKESGEVENPPAVRQAKVIAGEVIKQWQSSSRGRGGEDVLLRKPPEPWWASLVAEDDMKKVELSGKLVLLFEILRMAEQLGDKVLVFSQSILSLDLIELFLKYKTEEAEQQKPKSKKAAKPSIWEKDEDYLRMDGSTAAQYRKKYTAAFNETKNKRLRLFLISTRAGGLGINLEAANRVIIFDASWNPSHDIQSIFRVYRFGQEKDVYVYRLLAQGTMEEKIYERQVTKETLSQRVIDEHQIDRHFTASDLQELYIFKPEKLGDPDAPKRPTPAVPKDVILAELMSSKDWIVDYHEHDSLLENRPEENLSEEERKAAWEEYEKEKAGFYSYSYRAPQPAYANYNNAFQYNQYKPPDQLAGSFPNPGFPTPFPMYRPPVMPTYNTAGIVSAAMTSTFPGTSSGTTAGGTLGGIPSGIPSGIPFGTGVPNPINMPPLTLPQGLALNHPRLNFQIAQLPRVVQEILKYNPSITADELQNRLQAFLGMHARYNTASGPVTRPGFPPPPISTAPGGTPAAPGVSALPASYVAPTGLNMDMLMRMMPSRLPQPGSVPASRNPP